MAVGGSADQCGRRRSQAAAVVVWDGEATVVVTALVAAVLIQEAVA